MDESKEVSQALDNALGGAFAFADSKRFWTALAAGQHDFESLEWVKLVAARVLEANDGPARAAAMLRAVGLSGSDKHADLRALVQALNGMPGITPTDLIVAVRAAGLAEDIEGDDSLREIIRRELNKR